MDSKQSLYAMYVIGAVESNWDWTAVNYNDPITLGMMQWYGTRAANLLNLVKTGDPDGYAILAQSLRDSVEAHTATDSWWTTRYVNRAEGNSWKTAAARDEIHTIEQDLFIHTDIPSYVSVLGSWGVGEDNVKSLIFAMSMYHQSPRSCGQVIANVGDADLDTMWRAALNHQVLGQYANRYNRVHDLLTTWDGTSAPPDFGQTTIPDTNPGGDTGNSGNPSTGGGNSISQSTGITRITLNGNNLIVFTKEYPKGLVCVKTSGQNWIPTANTTGKPDAPNQGADNDTGGEQPSTDIQAMQQLWFDNANKWAYGQGAGRLNPPVSGYSDCSACIWWAINKIRPDLAKNIGTWTGTMVNSGREIARGTASTPFPTDKVKKGDILLIEWGYTNWSFNDDHSHVEWMTESNHNWGAGSSPLPHDNGATTDFIKSTGCWMLRRIL